MAARAPTGIAGGCSPEGPRSCSGRRPAREGVAGQRAKVAFDRLGWIARLGLPRAKLARLVAGSALTAGLYGTAAHVHDKDLLPTMRRVMHALYRGSRFAQVRLFMHSVLPCNGADPCRAALKKAWRPAP